MPGPTRAPAPATPPPSNFIRQIVIDDLRSGKHGGRVVTRFPPEPNGHLHLGHAKSICLNFGIAREFEGVCHLRFDDTNPTKEDVEYEESIRESVRWLGFDWGTHLYYASDYYDRLYEFAEHFIRTGRAYVDSLSADEIREFRGTLTEAGRESPFRDRPAEESLDLFRRMRDGEFADGAHVLRLKIDMSSPNINMRDPVIYRIRKVAHHRTGDRWCVYPLYDYAHCISDAIERITHSICTLEFQDHRPLYDWIIEELARDGLLARPLPQQYEFARGNLSYTVMSKRKLLQLVNEGHVTGWDDPRMPTLVGIRRLGYTPEAIRTFWERAGVTKSDSVIDIAVLEECVREDLNERAQRAMAVLRPLKLVIENYPEDRVEECSAPNHPQQPERGRRAMPFCRELWIERDDFAENPPKGYFRLAPGAEVRLRFAYIVRCERVVKDAGGNVTELRCTYDPDTRSGTAGAEARKVKGNIHWVSARHGVDAEVRLYDRLFELPNPDAAEGGFLSCLNPRSIEILRHAKLEPMLADATAQSRFQFERNGYFCVDRIESRPGALVFNRTATLKDSWAKSGR